MKDCTVGLIECPVGKHTEFQGRGGVGLILVRTRLVLLPVGETIAVVVTVKQVEIDPAKITVDLSQVEPAERTVPVSKVFPKRPPTRTQRHAVRWAIRQIQPPQGAA